MDGLESLPAGSFSSKNPPVQLRESIWRQSSAIVRGRRRRRRELLVGLVLLAYAAGMGTACFVPGSHGADLAGGVRQEGGWGPANKEGSPAADSSEMDQWLLDPERLEAELAAAEPSRHQELLKRAGDLRLSRQMDIEGALRCYRQFLDSESPLEQARPEAGDSWLLVFLKHARQKEMSREKRNG